MFGIINKMSVGVRPSSQNIVLMKDEVGKAKPSIHRLPPADFSFGRPIKHDTIGVAQRKFALFNLLK